MKNEKKYTAEKVVKYINKYVDENDNCYEMLLKLTKSPILQNEFSEQEWYYILEHAWKIAYANAMADNNITIQERMELNNINTLGLYYKNKSKNAFALKSQIFNNMHELRRVNEYTPPVPERKPLMPYPKPTPFNTGNNAYDRWSY